MIAGKTVLAIIPARGGSKGVPRKNVRNISGKPLLAWTIEEAKKSQYIDRLILSSDDEEIIQVALAWGCEVPFVRPKELARDDTPGIKPVLHAITSLPGYDYVVLLQPTSPLRRVDDIDGCIEKCLEYDSDACVSVTQAQESPYWMFTLDSGETLCPLLTSSQRLNRRQDLPQVMVLNGAVYVAKCKPLLVTESFITESTIGFEMPWERSLDIDTELDLSLFEHICKNEGQK